MNLWSISTTVRNPERLRKFLQVLKLLENQPFNTENQIKYQILLIQHKYYKPENIPNQFKDYFENPELKIPYETAKEIFLYQKYTDPPMRGRQSANPLNKLGFVIARETQGDIKITELGNLFLQGDYDIGYIFFKSLLKLQFPNPWSSDFTEKKGFNILPLIAAMHLINNVNNSSKKSGLTRTEFSLFIPSLINYKLINDYSAKIFEYRKTNKKDNFISSFAKQFYQTKKPTEKQINNFFEYGDNIMRYFRLTRYIKVSIDRFGADWCIDLEPTRKIEIEQILKKYNGEALKFNNTEEYLSYISDISLPKLPSEDINNLKKIAQSMIVHINNLITEKPIELMDEEKQILNTNLNESTKQLLEQIINKLRNLNLTIKEKQNKNILLNNIDKLNEIIRNLANYKTIRNFAPEQFEKIITEALKILNDEIKIKANYPTDDDGEPISHAPGNMPDIECYYNTYNAICEVTLNTSNYQWIRETQPVMRHLRSFENKNSKLSNYCIFIAPKIHTDTLYHFWTSIKHGYDGLKQYIIPLSTEQFALILKTLLISIQKNKRLKNTDLADLYNLIIIEANNVSGHSIWYNNIPEIIKKWTDQKVM